MTRDAFGARSTLATSGGPLTFYRLQALAALGVAPGLDRLPYSIRVLLEAVLRNLDGDARHRGGRAIPRELERRRLRGMSSCPSCPPA